MTKCRNRLIIAALCAVFGVASACAPTQGTMPAAPAVAPFPAETGRHALSYMVLGADGPADGQGRIYVSGLDARRISVALLSQARSRIGVSATCDGRARARPAGYLVTTPAWRAAGQTVTLELAPLEHNQTLLELGTEVTQCDLTVTPWGGTPYSLQLLREEMARPELAALDAPAPSCSGGGTDALSRAFLAGDGLSMTCSVPLGATRMLPDGVDALNAKVEALTGHAVSREALLQGDPQMALDWSNAPQLDLIYVNYLNLNADFAGFLIARMVAWHAARGTTVRILASGVMLTDTDRALFQGLAAQYPTVQIQPYRFPAEAARGFEDQIARLHRVSHVKVFGTVARQPGRSRVMIGGRNIHEGYFFDAPHDLSEFPFLLQYDPSQTRLTGGFTAYDDFEIELRSDAATRTIMQHMGALWHRDFDTQSPRPAGTRHPAPSASQGMVRHFISVPFADGQAQVDYYQGLIDAAQHRIRIATPYLNLPPALDAALHRARDRGVQVDVVTTVRVREATGFMVTGLNRAFANEFADWVTYTDYDPFPRLLHAKLIVIDDRLTVIASTNLNSRSFVHDLENGLVIMDRDISRGVTAVIESYSAAGERMAPGQDLPRLFRMLRGIGVIRRAF